jgi:Cu/Ag efflux protein CusF
MFTRIAAAALVATTPAGLSAPALPKPAIVPAHEGHRGATQANGTVNAVDAAEHRVNLSHGSIKALGWPAMTMDFPVDPDVDLSVVKPGMRVNFTLVRRSDGQYQVDTIRPVDRH